MVVCSGSGGETAISQTGISGNGMGVFPGFHSLKFLSFEPKKTPFDCDKSTSTGTSEELSKNWQ